MEKQQDESYEVFEKEFWPQADALYTFAFNLTHDDSDADDLIQETYMKAFQSINSYEKGTNPKAWLFKILRNNFINKYRSASRRPTVSSIDDVILSANADDEDPKYPTHVDLRTEIFDSMMGDEVTVSINSLPVDFRIVILLCDIEGFTYEEIASILGVPIGTVRSRLHRARNLLKNKLSEYAKAKGYIRD